MSPTSDIVGVRFSGLAGLAPQSNRAAPEEPRGPEALGGWMDRGLRPTWTQLQNRLPSEGAPGRTDPSDGARWTGAPG